jgi:tetratricopeptide (TPR) repeat protein
MSNLILFFKQVISLRLCKALLYGGLLMTLGCQSPKHSDQEPPGKEETQNAPTGSSPNENTDLNEEAPPTPLQEAYARALRLAEQGDAATLLLCDSLLSFQGPQGGAEPYYYKGIYYETKGDIKQAIIFFDKTLAADYTFYEGYIEKAALLIEIREFTAAAKELELLRSLSPGYAPVHYWWGKWAEQQGKDQQALEHYRMAISLDGTLKEAKEAMERLQK